MPSPYLTKSDFKACLDCRTKLFFRKNRYPTNLEENEYLRFLADGGFMIEFIAKARFPGGIDLVDERDPVRAFQLTQDALTQDNVVIFEGAATVGKYHVRADILQRIGRILNLIEVKSSSITDDKDDAVSPFLTKKGAVISRWKEYLMDVAFQAHVLKLAFPQFEVKPHLCVVDKGQLVTDPETLRFFSLEKDSTNPKARPVVTYQGDLAALQKSKLLTIRATEREVALLMPEVILKAEELSSLIVGSQVTRAMDDFAEHYRNCRVCEYRVEGPKSGFRECWGALAENPAHILDLHRVGQIGSAKVPDPVPALLRRRSASYLDLSVGELGSENAYQARRLMQWQSMKAGGTECLPDSLRRELVEHLDNPGFPLHFVDFEACDLALPHHASLHAYERVAFQWSCHTITSDGQLFHREWLNTTREFPNFAFARTLAECLGEAGTVYVWSKYEQVTLRKVLRQLEEWCSREPERALCASGLRDAPALGRLADWIDRLLGPEDEEGGRHSARIRDLHELAYAYYFHPRMRGRTSIKVVLPAVWETDRVLRSHPWFRGYVGTSPNGEPLDPYKVLQPLPFGDDEEADDVVREGTGAIRVYQDLIFASCASPEDVERRKTLLLQYCRLDTAAMLMIWMHWTGRYGL